MAYSPPAISSAGLTIPSYSDIISDMVSSARSIFGQDIYLDPSSQDYQLLSIFALKLNDALSALQAVYGNRGPQTAIGAGLDSLVKLNGLARLLATSSTCVVTVTGVAGTIVTNGVVKDTSGFLWNLPTSVTIGQGGTVTATATCQTAGPVAAAAGTLTIINTPTYGWTSVTNAAAATVGTAVETDSALRARHASSTALPSKTVLEGTEAAIGATSGVTRSVVYENDQANLPGYEVSGPSPSTNISAGPGTTFQIAADADVGTGTYHAVTLTLTSLTTGAAIATAMQTAIQALGGIYAAVTVAYTTVYTVTSGTTGINSALCVIAGASNDVAAALKLGIANGATDVNGWPGHSITCVVEGGASTDVATAIWAHKGPGCLANGTTSVILTDSYGQTTPIGFYVPAYVDVDVVVTLHALSGYTTATTTAIQAAIAAYLSSLAIGQNAQNSSLWGAALSAQTLTSPTFSITSLTACVHGGAPGTGPVPVSFNQVARGNQNYVTVTVS